MFYPKAKSLITAAALLAMVLGCQPALACTLAHWSTTHDADNALNATESARYDGACGLRIDLDTGTSPAYVEDASPGSRITPVTDYVVRFYLYSGDMMLADGDEIEILRALDSASNPVFSFQLYALAGQLFTRLTAYEDDGSGWYTGSGLPLLPGWRAIELTWSPASRDGTNDGTLLITVDEVPGETDQNLSDLDNDEAVIDRTLLGLVSGNTATVTGLLDIDSFVSGRSGSMGRIGKDCSGTDVVVENATFVNSSINDCSATGTLALGHRVTLDPGSTTRLDAASVILGPGVRILRGAELTVR